MLNKAVILQLTTGLSTLFKIKSVKNKSRHYLKCTQKAKLFILFGCVCVLKNETDKVKRLLDRLYSLTAELSRSIDKCSEKMRNLNKGLRLGPQILFIPALWRRVIASTAVESHFKCTSFPSLRTGRLCQIFGF